MAISGKKTRETTDPKIRKGWEGRSERRRVKKIKQENEENSWRKLISEHKKL